MQKIEEIKEKIRDNKEKIIKGVLGFVGVVSGILLIGKITKDSSDTDILELESESEDISEEVSTEEE